MLRSFAAAFCQRPNAFFPILALLAAVALAGPAAGAPERSGTDSVTPVEEYAKQVDELKKSYPDLGKRIEDSARSIDEMNDVDKARKEIEELRSVVAGLLGAVSDNGTVSQLGAKALAHGRGKLKSIEQDARFKPEEREFLLDQWRKLVAETERATEDLEGARKEFADLLRTLQTREDFIDELMQVRRASEALAVIRNLTREIRDASTKLKSLIGGLKPPGV
jgi:DNA repair exonuclease SbcCD ATPase subunit